MSKPHVSVVLFGHVDAGKSTLAGHLLYKCGTFNEKSLRSLCNGQFEGVVMIDDPNDKEYDVLADLKFNRYKFAWLLDSLLAERERGITIDISTKQFESSKYTFTLIDTPGHRDFIKNMITGTSMADVGIAVIDATPGSFEGGWTSDSQTREHILLAYTLGVKQLVVAINKMDMCYYDNIDPEARFNDVKETVTNYLHKVGFKDSNITFIPTSGFCGDNLVDKSESIPWYDGPTLLEALDNVKAPPRLMAEKSLRIPIQQVYRIGGIGVVALGRVAAGVLKPGMPCCLAPSDICCKVGSIESHGTNLTEATAGDYVGFNLRSISVNEVKRGHVASNNNDDPAKETKSFTANIIIMDHPGQIKNGYCPVLHCHTAQIATKFENIDEKLDRKSGKLLEVNPRFVRMGDMCRVNMVPMKPLVVEEYIRCPPLGRFAIRDLRRTVAVGVVFHTTITNNSSKGKSARAK
jgi:elongation factor 1-alpha